MKICIIGAGWYGCHLALSLKKAGHDVTLYEKNAEIFSQISGSFGIRLHAGPHYPRSPETRKSCRRGFSEFLATYPELVIPHEYSIYGLGKEDADGNPSKVSEEEFTAVGREYKECQTIDMGSFGYQGLISAINLDEPSIILGKKLRTAFTKYLNEAGIRILCNFEVTRIEHTDSAVCVGNEASVETFDKMINATSYQAFLPNPSDFPFDMEVVYQPCLALVYEDQTPGIRPFSFIVMDGWFPCLMPYVTGDEADGALSRNYILTHGKWTIMGSFKAISDAKDVLAKIDEAFIVDKIKEPAEKEMRRFWPSFGERFKYVGWKGEVLAKLKTKKEFRSAVTYEKENIIHVMPGKVSNIFDVEHEVCSLLKKENILTRNGYSFIKGGVLDEGFVEIAEKPAIGEPNTANLCTFDELQRPKETLRSQQTHGFFPKLCGEEKQESRESPHSSRLTSSNQYFKFQCIAGITVGLATLGFALLTFPRLGTVMRSLPLSIMEHAQTNLRFRF